MISDMSARRLKREYIRSVKQVWFWERVVASPGATPLSDQSDLGNAKSHLSAVSNELKRRGWTA